MRFKKSNQVSDQVRSAGCLYILLTGGDTTVYFFLILQKGKENSLNHHSSSRGRYIMQGPRAAS